MQTKLLLTLLALLYIQASNAEVNMNDPRQIREEQRFQGALRLHQKYGATKRELRRFFKKHTEKQRIWQSIFVRNQERLHITRFNEDSEYRKQSLSFQQRQSLELQHSERVEQISPYPEKAQKELRFAAPLKNDSEPHEHPIAQQLHAIPPGLHDIPPPPGLIRQSRYCQKISNIFRSKI